MLSTLTLLLTGVFGMRMENPPSVDVNNAGVGVVSGVARATTGRAVAETEPTLATGETAALRYCDVLGVPPRVQYAYPSIEAATITAPIAVITTTSFVL
jgi:hypothetical protein